MQLGNSGRLECTVSLALMGQLPTNCALFGRPGRAVQWHSTEVHRPSSSAPTPAGTPPCCRCEPTPTGGRMRLLCQTISSIRPFELIILGQALMVSSRWLTCSLLASVKVGTVAPAQYRRSRQEAEETSWMDCKRDCSQAMSNAEEAATLGRQSARPQWSIRAYT